MKLFIRALFFKNNDQSKSSPQNHLPSKIQLGIFFGALTFALIPASFAQSSDVQANHWWYPGQGDPLPESILYPNASGMSGILNVESPVITEGHAFFEPIGSNGRACVTCHQPSDNMSISLSTIQQRWYESNGSDPLFAAFDGSNCPNLDQSLAVSHSLLLERGLIRIGMPWPGLDNNGEVMEPEFTIEIVRDPTGCNTNPVYGLESENPTLSVYRRPRPVANLKYVATEGGFFNIKTGMPLDQDPEFGNRVGMNMMSDSRAPTLRMQARDAAANHLQLDRELTETELQQIESFERQVYMAQSYSTVAGDLTTGGASAGPNSLFAGRRGLGDDYQTPAFGYFEEWLDSERFPADTPEQQAFRESIIRGNEIFMDRQFWISDATHINTLGLGNPLKRSCATCHNMLHTGMDLAPGYVDLGTTNFPTANAMPDLPLFKLTCDESAPPHPYLGREIYTTDPGRALASGLCVDIGAITMQQMRGLAGRAPYFVNGSANTLREVIDFYDRRFNIGYSEQEKQDLVNFMSVL